MMAPAENKMEQMINRSSPAISCTADTDRAVISAPRAAAMDAKKNSNLSMVSLSWLSGFCSIGAPALPGLAKPSPTEP
jgi:hypothetical protein